MNPFYNHEQKRLKAIWRILIQGALYLIGLSVISTVIGFVVVLIMTVQGQVDLDMFSDPQVLTNAIMSIGGGWFMAFYSLGSLVLTILTVLLAGWLLDKRKFSDFGFRFSKKWWLDLGFGLLLGAALMLLIFVIELAFGWIKPDGLMVSRNPLAFLGSMLAALLTFISVGAYEEILFRGYILRNLVEGLNWKSIGARGAVWAGYLISSIGFGIAHATNPNSTAISTFNLILAGLFLGLGFVLTGELAISIGLHITWNFFQGNVFGFPVSGVGTGVSLINISQQGPDLVTGGAFGPEAGLIGIFAMLVGTGLILWYVRRTRGKTEMRKALADYQVPVKNAREESVEHASTQKENEQK